jgi:scyllo-inositol 2-dehydrogenase (NADP+)
MPASTVPILRVVLSGFGLAGGILHAPLIAATPGLELVAAVTGDPQRRALLAERHPGAVAAESLEEVLAMADVVVVATPNRLHVPQARAALAAGAHVVVDKPVAIEPEALRELGEAGLDARRLIIPFHNRRWDDDLLTLRRLLDEGVLGRVRRFESRFDRWRPEIEPGRWREAGTLDDGGGLLLDLGTHLVDQAITLFGPVVAVYAELAATRRGAEVEDDVFLALAHADGMRSHLWAGVHSADDVPRMRVLGDKATFVSHGLDPQEDQLRAGGRPGDEGFGRRAPERAATLHDGTASAPVSMEVGRWTAFYDGLVAAIAHGGAAPVLVGEAVAVAEVLEAARRSAAAGAVVVV